MRFIIKDLKLQVIATFDDNDQDIFEIAYFYADELKNEASLLDSIRGHLKRSSNDLVKLSLCWICKNLKPYKKVPAIRDSLEKNGKYFFGSWA